MARGKPLPVQRLDRPERREAAGGHDRLVANPNGLLTYAPQNGVNDYEFYWQSCLNGGVCWATVFVPCPQWRNDPVIPKLARGSVARCGDNDSVLSWSDGRHSHLAGLSSSNRPRRRAQGRYTDTLLRAGLNYQFH